MRRMLQFLNERMDVAHMQLRALDLKLLKPAQQLVGNKCQKYAGVQC